MFTWLASTYDYYLLFQATQFSINYVAFSGPEEHIPGREMLESAIQKANFSSSAFSFSKVKK